MSQPIPQWAIERGVLDQTKQFAMVPVEVIDLLRDARALALYVILKRYAARETQLAYPSRQKLASLMGYKTLKAVDEAITALKDHGLVVTFPRFRDPETGEISIEQKEGFGRTANGYILRELSEGRNTGNGGGGTPPYGPQDTPPLSPIGDTPHTPEGTPPMPYRGQYLYEDEPNPRELETPPNPPRGEAAPAEREPAKEPAAEKSAKRGEYLPEGWMPPRAAVEALRAKYPHVDQRLEFEKFTDYWRAASGQRARKRDWVAAYRTWIRNAASFAPPSAPAGYGSTPRVGTSPEEWLATLKQPTSDVIEGEVIGDALE